MISVFKTAFKYIQMSSPTQEGGKKQDAKKTQQQWCPSKPKDDKKNSVPKLKFGHSDFHVLKEVL